MSRQYNFIYSKLVESETDIIGHIAYSLYKTDKIDFINEFKRNNEKDPEEEDFNLFHLTLGGEGQLERYKMEANLILQNFCNNTLETTIKEIEKIKEANIRSSLKEIVHELNPKTWKSILSNIAYSFVGAFLLAILGAAFVFIKTYNN